MMAGSKKVKATTKRKAKSKPKAKAKAKPMPKKPPAKEKTKQVFEHLTGDDLGQLVKVDIGLAIKVGELQSVKAMEKFVEEIKTCWLHLGMTKQLAVFKEIMDSGVAEEQAYQKKWYE